MREDFLFDTLFIGSTTMDLIMLIDSPPESDRRINGTRFVTTTGGVAANAACAHHNLGGRTALITITGDDDAGSYIDSELRTQHFACLRIHKTSEAASSTSLILTEPDGKRCICCHGGCIDRLSFEDIDAGLIKQSRILHLGVMNYDLMLKLARFCKNETSALLSVDGGNIPREIVDELLPYTDIFIPDDKTAFRTLGLNPEEACRYYTSHGAGFAAVTTGAAGATGYDGFNVYNAPAAKVTAVDTTGAGDNFHGAFLYALNRGKDPGYCLRFASVYASLSCEEPGGRTAAPSLEKVRKIISLQEPSE